MKTAIATKKAPEATGPFEQAVKVGNMIFTSGQVYLTPEGKLLEGTIKEQAKQILENLKNILEEAGASFA
jgi:2-iminobutanoate/2-iminopropanoate deaminase